MLPGLTTVTYVGGAPVDETLTHYRVMTFLLVAEDCPLSDEAITEIDRPMLSNVDGPFHAYRDWYAQFHPRIDADFSMAEAAE
jgi:hypothetical protein